MNDYWVKQTYIFFIKDKVPSRKKVLKAVGVLPDTFAGNTVLQLYDLYFSNAVDFSKEYAKYYRHEFKSLKDFIEQRYNINAESAETLSKGNYCMKSLDEDPDKGIEDLNGIDSFRKAFENVIAEAIYEN